MNRTDLINYFIRHRKYKSYLEISVHDHQNNFAHISCGHKVITLPTYISEDFFKNNHQEFDIIFIDGVHTEDQTMQDITSSQRFLHAGGIIILHDCMPPDAWHQREKEEFREGENWNGTVWKASLRVFNESPFYCTVIDTDWGCGVIDTAHTQFPRRRALPEELNYQVHYSWLLEYKISIAVFLREQVKVFYHLACMGNWKQVFQEQILQLWQNGFKRICMTILGTDEDLNFINSTCEELNLESSIIFHNQELTNFEKPALLAVENYARQNEGFVLYLHSKGVSNPADDTKNKWRRLMMRELIENWEYCMLQLPNYDLIGVNWREMYPTSHFCGNFWYASTNYLRKLTDFTHYYDNPRYKIWDTVNYKRLGCEFWISSSREMPRVLSLFCKNVDFCNHEFWKNR